MSESGDVGEALLPGRPLVDSRGAGFDLGVYVVGVTWLGPVAAFACGDGSVRFLDPVTADEGPTSRIAAHDGAILCSCRHPEGDSLLTGGDDGRLLRTWPTGRSEEVASISGRWIEHVAASAASGAVVFAAGREACVLLPDRDSIAHRFAHASTVAGVALDAKGRRLAVAHYGGVTLWWVLAAQAEAKSLPWRGSHLGVAWSPDGRFVVSSMQENALHGWRVGDGGSMHMQGYPAKIRSLAWADKDRRLATSGADRVVCWPFVGKDGPMNKRPLELGPGGLLVTRVAAHPTRDTVAAGYEDGSVLLLRVEDDRAAVVQVAGGGPVSALSWSTDGGRLAFGTEDGAAGVVVLDDRR